ncbi:hypothetical protein V8E55_004136 [Tylopilus felleus]
MDIGRANRRTAILTIAGTDPCGRDSIQANLKTFAAHGCHGTSIVTVVTAQNRTGVLRHVMPPHFIEQQACITSTLKDIRVHAIKTRTLFNSEITKAVASSLKFLTHGPVPFVCDSVYVSEYGVILSAEDVKTVVKELFPLAHVITMSEAEAQYLLHVEDQPLQITSLADVLSAAQKLLTLVLGPQAVLLKGGRTIVSTDDILSVKAPNDAPLEIKSDFPLGDNIKILISHSTETKDYVVNVLCCVITMEPNTFIFTLYPWLACRSKNIQGVNASFSVALACALGNETSVEEAVAQVATYTRLGIDTALSCGKGASPLTLNHLHSTSRLVVPPKTPQCPYPLTFKFIQNTAAVWKQYLGKGTLDRRSFEHFLKQDYLYLKYYARAYALLASKYNDYASIYAAAKLILGIQDEMKPGTSKDEPLKLLMARKNAIHTFFFEQWGRPLQDLEKTPESPATTAYSDTTVLIMAVAACLLGYGEVGMWLKKEAQKPNSWVLWEGNPYLGWIKEYSGERYQKGVINGLSKYSHSCVLSKSDGLPFLLVELMERVAEKDTPSKLQYDVWFPVWQKTVRFEKAFWDMALTLS